MGILWVCCPMSPALRRTRGPGSGPKEFSLPENSVQIADLACALQHLEDAHLIYILQTPTNEEPCFYVELSEIEPPSNEEL